MSSSSTTNATGNSDDLILARQSINEFCEILSSKQPTPGGGASAAIGAAIGAALGAATWTARRARSILRENIYSHRLRLIVTLSPFVIWIHPPERH